MKAKTAGSRDHVEMVVGHHALIASFVRNEFEIALVNRTWRRGGNGSSTYFHCVYEFAASIELLAKNRKGYTVHSGYRIMGDINSNVVVRMRTGWVFSKPATASSAEKAPAAPSRAVSSTCARMLTSSKRAGSSAIGIAAESAATAAATARREASNRGVGITRSREEAPTGVVIFDDDTADNGDSAALIGLRVEGAATDGGGCDMGTWRGNYGAGSAADGTNKGGSDSGVETQWG